MLAAAAVAAAPRPNCSRWNRFRSRRHSAGARATSRGRPADASGEADGSVAALPFALVRAAAVSVGRMGEDPEKADITAKQLQWACKYSQVVYTGVCKQVEQW